MICTSLWLWTGPGLPTSVISCTATYTNCTGGPQAHIVFFSFAFTDGEKSFTNLMVVSSKLLSSLTINDIFSNGFVEAYLCTLVNYIKSLYHISKLYIKAIKKTWPVFYYLKNIRITVIWILNVYIFCREFSLTCDVSSHVIYRIKAICCVTTGSFLIQLKL